MKRTAIALSLGLLTGLPGAALAQAEHDTHHAATPAAEAPQPSARPPHAGAMPAMQAMAEQCKAMMKAMSAAPDGMGAMHAKMHDMMGATEAGAIGQASGTVYSANEGGNSVSAIDLATGTVRTVKIPVSPHNVDLTPDGKLLLAVGNPASDGDHGSDGHGHGGADVEGLLSILDAQDISAPRTVAVGAHPAHVVADGQGRAFVSLAGGDAVAVVDLARAELIGRIETGDYPHGLRLSPDGAQLYVANVEGGSVSVIDTASLAEIARIPVGEAPVQVGFTPDGDRVYISLRDENRVAVIDTASQKVTARIDVGPNPIQVFATADGASVYVANQGSEEAPNNTVSVIDTASGAVAQTITTGGGAHGVSASADGAYIFVTNIVDDSVSVIDAASRSVIRNVPVGDRPNGIAYGRSN